MSTLSLSDLGPSPVVEMNVPRLTGVFKAEVIFFEGFYPWPTVVRGQKIIERFQNSPYPLARSASANPVLQSDVVTQRAEKDD